MLRQMMMKNAVVSGSLIVMVELIENGMGIMMM